MNNVLFSIIVPVYNAEKYLRNNLDNIYFDKPYLQYIFINDGSEDGTEEILAEFCADHSNSEFYSITHGGVSSARNYGIEQAVGKYIMFCDADDGYAINTFDCLKEYIFSDYDIIIFGAKINNLSDRFRIDDIEPRNSCFSKPQIMDAFYGEKGTWPYVWNCCYNRNFILNRNIRFKCELDLGEDLIFQFEAFMGAENVKFINDKLYIYNYCTASSSVSHYLNDPIGRIEKHLKLVMEVDYLYSVNNLERDPKYCEWVLNFLFYDLILISTKDRNRLMKQYNLNLTLKNKHIKNFKCKIKFAILKNSILILLYRLYRKLKSKLECSNASILI